jgi:hypothetical protein
MTPEAVRVEADGTMTVRLSLADRRALARALEHRPEHPRSEALLTLWRLVRVEPPADWQPAPTDAEVAEYDREQAEREQRVAWATDRWPDPSATDLCAPPFGDARP